MPGGFPLGLELCNGKFYGRYPGATVYPIGTPITASASANTMGAWTQLVASTTNDASWALVTIISNYTYYDNVAVNIGVGSSGNEIVLVPYLVCPYYWNGGQGPTFKYSFPLSIPAGTRISAQAQGSGGGENVQVSITLFDAAFTQMEGAAGVDAIGFNAASTIGTPITPGNAAQGAFTQIIGSTSRDYIGLFGAFDNTLSGSQSGNYEVDVAIGPSGLEQIIIPGFLFDIAQSRIEDGMPFFPIPIPAGTRIAACGNFYGSTLGNYDLTLYGIRQ